MCLPMEEGPFWFGQYHVVILLEKILLIQKESLNFGHKFK